MAKAKDFLFNVEAWLGGTQGMSLEEKGAYMELLIFQFTQGHMTGRMIGRMIGRNWDNIKQKFILDDEGKWYNERMEIAKTKRNNFIISRIQNPSGKNQYSKNGGHTTYHTSPLTTDVFNCINIESKLEEVEVNNTIEYIYRIKNLEYNKSEIENFWEAFKCREGEDLKYKSRGEALKHFRNWLKTQDNVKKGTSAARTNAAKNW